MVMTDKEIEKAKEKKIRQVRFAAATAMFREFFGDVEKKALYVNESVKKITIGFDRDDGFTIEVALSNAWLSVWLEKLKEFIAAVERNEGDEELLSFDSEAMRVKIYPLFTVQKSALKCSDRRLRKIKIAEGIRVLKATAFAYCESLERVEIPKSVEYIHNRSFWSCSSLKSLTVDTDNPYFCTIENTLYTKDRLTLLFTPPLNEPTIVDGVKTIAVNAFAFNTKLKELKLPDSVEKIETNAFCFSGFEKIELNEGLREIEEQAFHLCNSLKEVIIPSTVEVLHASSFYSCPVLEKVIFRGNTKIEPKAFSYCNVNIQIVKA